MHAILVDRDGVINRERSDYVKSWDEFEFLSGTFTALKLLSTLGIPILIVTNQSVIGRGITDVDTINDIHATMTQLVVDNGGRIDHIFVCPHAPVVQCDCRKPKPGMLLQAQSRYQLDLSKSFFIGDSITDYIAAKAAGCQPILVRTGRQGSTIDRLLLEQKAKQVPVMADLRTVANHLISGEKDIFR